MTGTIQAPPRLAPEAARRVLARRPLEVAASAPERRMGHAAPCHVGWAARRTQLPSLDRRCRTHCHTGARQNEAAFECRARARACEERGDRRASGRPRSDAERFGVQRVLSPRRRRGRAPPRRTPHDRLPPSPADDLLEGLEVRRIVVDEEHAMHVDAPQGRPRSSRPHRRRASAGDSAGENGANPTSRRPPRSRRRGRARRDAFEGEPIAAVTGIRRHPVGFQTGFTSSGTGPCSGT
jgi:hypothetical protein